MDAVIIRIIDLPCAVRGFTVKDENDDYNIYINARLSEEGRVEAFWHEVEHIRLGHFYDERPVMVKEREVHYGKAEKNEVGDVDRPGLLSHG